MRSGVSSPAESCRAVTRADAPYFRFLGLSQVSRLIDTGLRRIWATSLPRRLLRRSKEPLVALHIIYPAYERHEFCAAHKCTSRREPRAASLSRAAPEPPPGADGASVGGCDRGIAVRDP